MPKLSVAPTLAVILTNYNHGQFVAHALRAITSQSYHPDKLIIVDDGSNDDSIEAIAPFLADPRVVLVQHSKNRGLGEAVLTGLKSISTDYVYFAASDDHVLPGFFQRAMEAATANSDLGMIFGRLAREGLPTLRPGYSLDDPADHSQRIENTQFFKMYFREFGAMTNVSPATVYRVKALDAINYPALLASFDFVLDSFVVQLIGGKYPSFFVDQDCCLWVPSLGGGAGRFFSNPQRIRRFALHVTDVLRKEPYLSALSDEHFGLYLFCLWQRAIHAGYPFNPHELATLNVHFGGPITSISAPTAPVPDYSLAGALESAYASIRASQDHLKTLPVSSLRQWTWQTLLTFPRLALALSYRTYGLIRTTVSSSDADVAMGDSTALTSPTTEVADIVPTAPVDEVIDESVEAPAVDQSHADEQPKMDSARDRVPASVRRLTLSALICNYNHGHHIRRAIEAVLDQTRRPDELLIMDDGSTDDSISIIQQYADQCDWIRVIRKETNEGYIAGISELTRMARGDFIHRGTSDDFMLPNFVADLMAQAEAYPTVGIVSGDLRNESELVPGQSHIGIPGWASGFKRPSDFLRHIEESSPTSTLAPSTIFRRAVIEEVGGWRRELDIWDVSFVLQAAALRHGMGYVAVPVYTWVFRPKGWTYQTNQNFGKAMAVIKSYYELMISDEFKYDFCDAFPDRWLQANIRAIAEVFYNEIRAAKEDAHEPN